MTEELYEHDETIEDPDGRRWRAVVLGARRRSGTWVGWIRFRDPARKELLETDRETTQPKRDDLLYWATGLSRSYLEGALIRARRRLERLAHDGPAAPGGLDEIHPAGPRLEVVGVAPSVVQKIMGFDAPRPGTLRRLGEAGLVVYEGSGGKGDVQAHYFALRHGPSGTGAPLADWLWHCLAGSGAAVRVDGEPVELTPDALAEALAGR